MGLNYLNLDARTRKLMTEEIELDIKNGSLYLSPWLTDIGKADWPSLLLRAAASGSDATLATEIPRGGRLHTHAQRKNPKGGFTTYRVPVTAPDTMSEGEFNRFYVRALCRRAIEDRIPGLIVYRAKAVENPRPGSEEKVGSSIDPEAVLNDLRASPGLEPALGLPPGPNSGLSAKLP